MNFQNITSSQAYVNFQTVISGFRLRKASASVDSPIFSSLSSINWIIDNSTDSTFINNVCDFICATLHHLALPERLFIDILNCIDYQSIITSKITRSNSFYYSSQSNISTIRMKVTSYREKLPFGPSTFEVATDVTNLFHLEFEQEEHSSFGSRQIDENTLSTLRSSFVENLLSTHTIADLYFKDATIPFLIYAPPHSGKTTFQQRISERLPVRDTDVIRELDFYTEIHITNMSHLLAQAITAIAILPSSGEFKSRCLSRSLPYQQSWYRDAVDHINVAKARAPDRIRVVKTDLYVTDAIMSLQLIRNKQSIRTSTLKHYVYKIKKAIVNSTSSLKRPSFLSV